jgi:hypothetical protein
MLALARTTVSAAYADEVPESVTDEREPVIIKICDDQFTQFAGGNRVIAVEDFNQNVFNTHVQSRMAFTLTGNAAGFQSPIPIEDLAAEDFLNYPPLLRVKDFSGREDGPKFDTGQALFLHKPGKVEKG